MYFNFFLLMPVYFYFTFSYYIYIIFLNILFFRFPLPPQWFFNLKKTHILNTNVSGKGTLGGKVSPFSFPSPEVTTVSLPADGDTCGLRAGWL